MVCSDELASYRWIGRKMMGTTRSTMRRGEFVRCVMTVAFSLTSTRFKASSVSFKRAIIDVHREDVADRIARCPIGQHGGSPERSFGCQRRERRPSCGRGFASIRSKPRSKYA